MTSVGETLRRERLRRNLDLDQISRELRISTKFLDAIEAEKFEILPGAVFARSFVRQYAHLLGLDAEELTAEVRRTVEPAPEPARAQDEPKTVMQGIQVPRMDQWERVGDRRTRWLSSLPSLGLVALALLGCSLVYTWWQRASRAPDAGADVSMVAERSTPPASEPPAAAEAPSGPAAPPTDSQPAQPAPVPASEVAGAPPAAPGVQTPAVPHTPPRGGRVRVQVTAEEPVWVLARADGNYLFSGTLEAAETRSVEAAGELLLRFGNAGGVTVTLNGKPLGPMGPKGQVRTVQFTSGGFQIVAASKPPSPGPL